jgi:predicted nucleic-acid-binding protein
MQIVDTNIILRYVLQDHAELYAQAKTLLESQTIFIPVEIVAEAVYVLEKVYKVERNDIRQTFVTLCGYEHLTFAEKDVVMASLSLYCEHRIDYIDAILCAYHQVRHATIHSFDKRVQKIIKNMESPAMTNRQHIPDEQQ